MSLVAIQRQDLSLGMPLPWAVFDQDGNTLLPQGATLDSQDQLQALLAKNPLREVSWNTAPSALSPVGMEAAGGGPEAGLVGNSAASGFTFQDMKLKVGDRIQIQPPVSVSQERHVVKLIGYIDGISLLVTSPLVNGLRLPFEEQDEIVARVFSAQNAFGFSSLVVRICKTPVDYLHLSFPQQIQGSIIRKSPRVRTRIVTLIATLPAAAGTDRQSGIIANLSADGALLKVPKSPLEKGQTVQLSFRVTLHQVDAYLTVTAIVRSILADEERSGADVAMFSHGIQFQNLPPNDNMILQSLIYKQMIEQPATMT